MDKRGIIYEFGGLVVASLIILGSLILTSNQIISEHRYVGDETSHLYYDLKVCETKDIKKGNLINFKDEEEAIKNDFKPAPCIQKR